jgi:hypothetical protein
VKRLFIIALSSTAAIAGESKISIDPKPQSGTSYYALGEATAVGKADYNGALKGAGKKGSGAAWEGRFQLGVSHPLPQIQFLSDKGGMWHFRTGLDYQHIGFEHDSSFALPSKLQRVAGVLALEYRVGRQLGILLEARPGVYFEDEISSNAWNCPVVFGMGIPVSDSFTLAVGGRFDANATMPIIGGPGFLWKITDRLSLLAIPPEPVLTFNATENLDLWLRGEWASGTYRTASQVTRGDLSGQIVDYTDKRLSIGATWRSGDWRIEAGAGASFDREWDFDSADRKFSTDEVAPFAKLSVRAEW